jgi:hypothetical protein
VRITLYRPPGWINLSTAFHEPGRKYVRWEALLSAGPRLIWASAPVKGGIGWFYGCGARPVNQPTGDYEASGVVAAPADAPHYEFFQKSLPHRLFRLRSMTWKTGRNFWTGDLNTMGKKITYNQLRLGDMLLYHNSANPVNGSHVVLFHRRSGPAGGDFYIYEQAPPATKHRLWSTAGYSHRLYIPFQLHQCSYRST